MLSGWRSLLVLLVIDNLSLCWAQGLRLWNFLSLPSCSAPTRHLVIHPLTPPSAGSSSTSRAQWPQAHPRTGLTCSHTHTHSPHVHTHTQSTCSHTHVFTHTWSTGSHTHRIHMFTHTHTHTHTQSPHFHTHIHTYTPSSHKLTSEAGDPRPCSKDSLYDPVSRKALP